MSAGWEVGDLALCVNTSPCVVTGDVCNIANGTVYTVTGLVAGGSADRCSVGLTLAEAVAPSITGAYAADRFRKIKPDAHEGCEDAFVTLLKRSKRPVSA